MDYLVKPLATEVEAWLGMIALTLPWWKTALVLFGLVFGAVWIAMVFYELVKSPEWVTLLGLLFGVALEAFVIVVLLMATGRMPSRWLGSVVSSPWFFILFGVAMMAIVGQVWLQRHSPDLEVTVPLGMEDLKYPILIIGALIGFVTGAAVTILGILGLFDYRFIRYLLAYSSFYANHEDVINLVLASIWFLIATWLIISMRSIINGILIGLSMIINIVFLSYHILH